MLSVRKVTRSDYDDVWEIIENVIASGDTYVFDPSSTKEKMLSYWCDPAIHTFVVENEGRIAGTFLIRDNQPGLGSHIANAAFMTPISESGAGVGRFMAEYALIEAKRLGYSAMQFNFVVKTNHRAAKLWLKLGFSVIGEIPEAFNHRIYGLTNALIMYRKL